MNSFLEVAVETAREAGGILLAEFDRPVKISYKGEVDIVTQADKRSEAGHRHPAALHFPKHAIVAEEGGGTESEFSHSAGTWTPRRHHQFCPRIPLFLRFRLAWRRRAN
jgi:fructose-1,6-bisphosphatase/inositol monophosphatase family enzyme